MKRISALILVILLVCSVSLAETMELTAGLYVFAAQEGAALTVTGADGFSHTYTPENGAEYCFYLPEGANLSYEGGEVLPLAVEGLFSDEEQTLGPVGRYFVGAQLPRGGFSVRLSEDTESGYFLVSSMVYESGEGDEPERIDLTGELVAKLVLEDGQFIELHGCILTLAEGNG